MERNQVLSFIQAKLSDGTITRTDLSVLAEGGAIETPSAAAGLSPRPAVVTPSPVDSSRNLINTFYAIGALIAVAGAVILVAQYWEDIGFVGRLLTTLGIAIVTYVSALLLRAPNRRVISQVFFTIAAALAPLGVYVILNERSIELTPMVQVMIAAGLFVVFVGAFYASKRNILVLLMTFFATWTFYALLISLLDTGYGVGMEDLLKWATIVAGIAYILVGFWHRSVAVAQNPGDEKEKHAVGGILYGFGTLATLSAGISLGGIFDLLFIALVFATFYASVFLKSRSMLILAALFLIGHIFKLTYEYFVDSIGWPISLVVIGFLVIGVGAATYHVNKRFIK